MYILAPKIILPGLFFLLTLGSGFWLSRSGKPLNTIIFTIHKLIALAAVITTIGLVYGLLSTTHSTPTELILIAVSGLFTLTLFVTGALISIEKTVNPLVQTLHHIAPYLTAASITAALYLLGEI